jgi:hypothetical protein
MIQRRAKIGENPEKCVICDRGQGIKNKKILSDSDQRGFMGLGACV